MEVFDVVTLRHGLDVIASGKLSRADFEHDSYCEFGQGGLQLSGIGSLDILRVAQIAEHGQDRKEDVRRNQAGGSFSGMAWCGLAEWFMESLSQRTGKP